MGDSCDIPFYLLWRSCTYDASMIPKDTLKLINDKMEEDQGARFREICRDLIPKADDAFRGKESPFRAHLGASILGRDCAREIWYSFRWTTKKTFKGQLLRLFNRGHLEEPRMIALLLMIGCQVWSVNDTGKQYKVKGHFGHSGGSLDAVVLGIPECPDEPLLGEFKTHSEKSFLKLKEEGLIKAKWEHFIQMTTYMGKMNLRGAIYMAVNKNTDELYAELVGFDSMQYQRYEERAQMILSAKEPPARISQDKTFFKCKFCDHKDVCHGKTKPEPTCRSCQHSRMTSDGGWGCMIDGLVLSHAQQEKGCKYHLPMDFKVRP